MIEAAIIQRAVLAANSTGKKAWIIFADGDLDVTQDKDVAMQSHIIECVSPIEEKKHEVL